MTRAVHAISHTQHVSGTSELPAGAAQSTPAAAKLGVITLPPSFRSALRSELSRAFHPPFEVPLVIIMNAALVTGAWFLLPRSWFFDFTKSVAFPVALAGWMYADVPATNVLAPNRIAAIAALTDSPVTDWQVLRLLRAKLFMLWMLVTPPALIVAVITGWHQRHWMLTVGSMVIIAVLPFGVLAPASWVGIRYPYHPRALTWRWQQAKTDRRGIVRYTILVLAPYGVVPAFGWVALIPSGIVWFALGNRLPFAPIPYWQFAVLVAVICATAAGMWLWGHRLALRIVKRRREDLVAYLADPERG